MRAGSTCSRSRSSSTRPSARCAGSSPRAARCGSAAGALQPLTGTLSLDWKGALLAGRAVDHLVIRGSAEPGTVLVETRARGASARTRSGCSRSPSPPVPLFEGRWRALLAAASGSFAGSLGDVPAFLALWGVDAGKGGAAVPEHRLRLEGSLEKGTDPARAGRPRGRPRQGRRSRRSLVTFPREDQGWGETAFSGGATVDIPDLRDLSALFPMPPLSGSVRGEISGTGTFARPEGRVALTGRRIEVAGKKLGDVELRARGTAGEIEVDTLELRQGGNRFTAQGVRFSPAALAAADRSALLDSLAGSFTLRSTDLPALAALAGLPPEQVARTPATHLLTLAGTVRDRAIDAHGGILRRRGRLDHAAQRAQSRCPAPGRLEEGHDIRRATLRSTIPDLAPVATIFRLPPLRGSLNGRAQVLRQRGRTGRKRRSLRPGDRHRRPPRRRRRRQGPRHASGSWTIETLEINRGADRLRGRGRVRPGEGDAARGRGGRLRRGRGALSRGVRARGDPRLGPAARRAARHRVPRRVRRSPSRRSSPRGASASVQGVKARRSTRPTRPAVLRVGAFELTGSGGLAAKGEGTLPAGSRRGRHPEPRPPLPQGAGEHPRPGGTGLPGPPGVRPHGFPARRRRRHRVLEGARSPPGDPRGAAAAPRRDPLRAARARTRSREP